MKSLLNKANHIDTEEAKEIKGDTEKEIILTLLELPRVLNKAIDSKSLNDIAEYLYNLTSLYNKFYSENKVLTEENKDLQESWLVLTDTVYKVNQLLLDVLGINIPEKM